MQDDEGVAVECEDDALPDAAHRHDLSSREIGDRGLRGPEEKRARDAQALEPGAYYPGRQGA